MSNPSYRSNGLPVKDCLSNQSTDIIQYLATYLDQPTVIQIWQVSRRFKGIVGERVPLTFAIMDGVRGLNLITLFKKARLTALYGHSFTLTDSDCNQLSKYIVELDLWFNYTITDHSIRNMINLTKLNP